MMSRSSCGSTFVSKRRGSRQRRAAPGLMPDVPSEQQVVQHKPETVHVRAFRHRHPRSPLLGRHVGRRACERVAIGLGPRNRNAEIADAHEPVVVDEDVGGLQVAMEDPLRVGGHEARAQLAADVDDLLRRQPAHAPEQRREIFASDELHREEDHALRFADVEHAAHGRVGNLAGEPHLGEDPLARGRTRGFDDLQRHLGFEHEIVCAPDISHAAAADPLDHPIPAGKHFARREDDSGFLGRAARLGRIRCVVKSEQRFDLTPQSGIPAARIGQKGCARIERQLESREKQVLRPLR